ARGWRAASRRLRLRRASARRPAALRRLPSAGLRTVPATARWLPGRSAAPSGLPWPVPGSTGTLPRTAGRTSFRLPTSAGRCAAWRASALRWCATWRSLSAPAAPSRLPASGLPSPSGRVPARLRRIRRAAAAASGCSCRRRRSAPWSRGRRRGHAAHAPGSARRWEARGQLRRLSYDPLPNLIHHPPTLLSLSPLQIPASVYHK
ncbi:hypothetical protein PMAYCL1PPCAC_05036, partial [Pristionchus mayeri]